MDNVLVNVLKHESCSPRVEIRLREPDRPLTKPLTSVPVMDIEAERVQCSVRPSARLEDGLRDELRNLPNPLA